MPLNLTQKAIQDVLIDNLATVLTEALITNVSDDAKAGLVRAGKLQDDPTTNLRNVLIHPGGEKYPDELNEKEFGTHLAGEIGGGTHLATTFWCRYFVVEWTLFYTNESIRENARRRSHTLLQRAHKAIVLQDLSEIPADDFGERVYFTSVRKMWIEESGGVGDFIWRGNIVVEYFTTLNLG